MTASGAWADAPDHSTVSLLEGELSEGSWSAGVQIDLAEGWKTYWRMPGEAGIAPEFDWSKSNNVGEVGLRWPAPGRYQDASGETIGYAERVVFPLTVRPDDPARPVELVLDLQYAVCKGICVPARAEVRVVLDPDAQMSSVGLALIRQFDARVPESEAEGVKIERARVEEVSGAYRLAVVLAGEAVDGTTEIFVENFDRAYFRAPRPSGREGEARVFHLPIDDLDDPDALRGETLRLTVVTATARLVGEVTVE